MEEKRDPSVLLKKFMEWTKPKSNALAAASNFRGLEQGDLSLAQYIDKPLFCATSVNILQKLVIDYFEMQ